MKGEKIKIVVCLKQVPDPEGPPSAFDVIPEKKMVIPKGIPPVISPFDENALEAALRIKSTQECEITAISMGWKLSSAVLRKSLAVGADRLILMDDEIFDGLDSYSTAYALSMAIKKLEKYDLILTGRQASDWDSGQVGLGIAEFLRIPCITLARDVKIEGEGVVVERVMPGGREIIRTKMPALVTASNEIGELRSVSINDLRAALKKPITTWKAKDLGIDPSEIRKMKLIQLFAPMRGRKCHFVEGATLEEAGVNLALKLKEDKVI